MGITNKKMGIICTFGPSSWNYAKEFKDSGMSLARFNGSFGLPYSGLIKELKEIGIKILLDLPGERAKTKHKYIQDSELIEFAKQNKLDYVSISYVKNSDQITNLRKLVQPYGIKIIGKVETKEAIEDINNLKEIIKESDIVMIDRGDLSKSIGFEKVPKYQYLITQLCNQLNKEVIIATGNMMSKVDSEQVSCGDVANVYFSISNGADHIMLSEETAVGKYPLEAIQIVKKIINEFSSSD